MRLKFSLFLVTLLTSILLPLNAGAVTSLNDFVIDSYDIKFELSHDSDNRSVLVTTETIKANFLHHNRNHGIERLLPNRYDGHSTSLKIDSVKDQNGKSLKFNKTSSGDKTLLRIGDKNRYVYGPQTYVIKHQQRDVTKYFKNTKADEFYWDTNGTGWKVPIRQLNVSLTLGDGLEDQLNGRLACYQGAYGQSNRCQVEQSGRQLTVQADNLLGGDNVTLAVGFNPGTFAEYEPSLGERLAEAWGIAQLVTLPIAVGVTIWMFVLHRRWTMRVKEYEPRVVEYLPPKDSNVLLSGALVGAQTKIVAAQLIDLAVRNYIRIYELKKPSRLSAPGYEMKIVKSTADLSEEEKRLLRAMFSSIAVGGKLNLKTLKNDQTRQKMIVSLVSSLPGIIKSNYNLKIKNDQTAEFYKKVMTVLAVASVLLLSPAFLVATVLAYSLKVDTYTLTDKGLGLMRHLNGLKDYISLAETERIRLLQSPEGAAKAKVDASDSKQLVKLYERTLPYAILFGQEKEWNKVLASYYQQQDLAPSWYVGTAGALAAFNANSLQQAINQFSSTATSSSSTGGSSGGGFSGGGGGGGGGGGW